jgi:hypothetical protein
MNDVYAPPTADEFSASPQRANRLLNFFMWTRLLSGVAMIGTAVFTLLYEKLVGPFPVAIPSALVLLVYLAVNAVLFVLTRKRLWWLVPLGVAYYGWDLYERLRGLVRMLRLIEESPVNLGSASVTQYLLPSSLQIVWATFWIVFLLFSRTARNLRGNPFRK